MWSIFSSPIVLTVFLRSASCDVSASWGPYRPGEGQPPGQRGPRSDGHLPRVRQACVPRPARGRAPPPACLALPLPEPLSPASLTRGQVLGRPRAPNQPVLSRPPHPALEAPVRPWPGPSPHPALWPWGAQRGNEVIDPPFNGTGLSMASPRHLYGWRRARRAVVMLLGHGTWPAPGFPNSPRTSAFPPQVCSGPAVPHPQQPPGQQATARGVLPARGHAGHGPRRQAWCFHGDLVAHKAGAASRLSPHRTGS